LLSGQSWRKPVISQYVSSPWSEDYRSVAMDVIAPPQEEMFPATSSARISGHVYYDTDDGLEPTMRDIWVDVNHNGVFDSQYDVFSEAASWDVVSEVWSFDNLSAGTYDIHCSGNAKLPAETVMTIHLKRAQVLDTVDFHFDLRNV